MVNWCHMSYTKNPHLPLVRMQAVSMVRSGWSARKVGRYLGFHHTAVLKWLKKVDENSEVIPTESSRPHSHPKKLSKKIVDAIVKERKKHRRCAEVVHQTLLNQDISVSLSSVKRTLKRQYLLRERSRFKRWHDSIPRPYAQRPGDLVQIDTIHIVPLMSERVYIYTLIDLASRWTYAKATSRINTHNSLAFIREAQQSAPFQFKMIQSDHGSEFSTWFTEHVQKLEIKHRHSRVRRSNDNAHIERFNRTLQEESLDGKPENLKSFQRAIQSYLPYYNTQRLHLGINLKTPMQVVTSY